MAQKPDIKFDKLFQKLYNTELWRMAYEMIAPTPGNMTAGVDGLSEAITTAAGKAGDFGSTDQIDTTGLRASMDNVVQTIRDSMPKPEDVTPPMSEKRDGSKPDGKVPGKYTSEKLEPIVTSLGKVGGGGYGVGGLDMQRENNRLTSQTNLLITGLHETVKRSSGTRTAAFA